MMDIIDIGCRFEFQFFGVENMTQPSLKTLKGIFWDNLYIKG